MLIKQKNVDYMTIELQRTILPPKRSVSKTFYLVQLLVFSIAAQTLCTSLPSYRIFLTSLRALVKVLRWQVLTFLEFGESLRSKDHLII